MQVWGPFWKDQGGRVGEQIARPLSARPWQKQQQTAAFHLGAVYEAGSGGQPGLSSQSAWISCWYLGNGFCEGSCVSGV